MSTVHAALELIESISTAVDNKKHCNVQRYVNIEAF